MNRSLKQTFNNFPFNPSSSPVYYGWIVVLLGTLGVIMSAPGQTMGVATFTDYLIDSFQISRNQLSLAYMIGTILSSFAITKGGKIYDRIGARWLGVMITWMLGGILIVLSQSDRIAFAIGKFLKLENFQFYISFFVLIISFFFLRFSGQGVLTMLSRNMVMKWFVARRGLAGGISNVFVALGFSVAPLLFDGLIESYNWRNAWIILAIICGFGFSIVVFLFFRDNPEDMGMKPDGKLPAKTKEDNIQHKAFKQYTLKEARRTFPFWIFAIALSMQALFITGFSFHIVSIFAEAGMDKTTALAVFIPTSVISVVLTLLGGWISDHIKLKKLLHVQIAGLIISMISLAFLAKPGAYYFLILGNGLMGGMFSLLASVVWPRFYGRENLGAISGFSMSLIVFFSAIGLCFLVSLCQGLEVMRWRPGYAW